MTCPQCGTQNQTNARFCGNCGAALTDTTVPPAPRPWSAHIASLVVAGLCLVYLLNPTAGIFELIPDNFPVIGNLDEALATAGLLWALRNWGVRLPGW